LTSLAFAIPILREHLPELEWPGFRKLFGWVPFLVPTIVYTAMVLSLSGRLDDASTGFFNAATEIIAVLLLGLLLDTVGFGRRAPFDPRLNCFTGALLVLGLFVALYNLAEGKNDHADIVYASIGAGITGVFVAAILGVPTEGGGRGRGAEGGAQ
jgi:hypothetical protein